MSVRIGVIGCGHWGKNLVRNFSELNALACVCDGNQDLASQMSDTYLVPVMDLDTLYADDSIDGVVIAAPAELHADLAIKAFHANKHVFVEKPLAMNAAESHAMIAAAKQADRHLMVGHLLQYHPAFLRLKKLVEDGELGDIRHIASNRMSFGKLRAEEDVVWSFAPHDISMILALLGKDPFGVRSEKMDFTGNGLADKASLTLEFENFVTAQITVSWLNPEKEQKLSVIGTRAMAVFDDTKPWHEKLCVFPQYADTQKSNTDLAKAEAYFVPIKEAEPLKLECQYFIDLIAGIVSARTDGQEGARVLKVLTSSEAPFPSS